MRIDFLVCGAQKAGTTALDAILRQHPGVLMPRRRKELHFFDNPGCVLSQRHVARYHSEWDWAGGARARGEVTPSYMFMPGCVERIKAYSPTVRLIVVLRDPTLRAYSHWQMERNRVARL